MILFTSEQEKSLIGGFFCGVTSTSIQDWRIKMKKILLATLIAISLSAHAEKWVSVGANMYVATASQRRDGDIGGVTLKFENSDEWVEFDCVNRKLIKYPSKELQIGSPLHSALKIACSRWFEVWKK